MPTKLTVKRPSDYAVFLKEAIYQGIHERFQDQVRLYPNNIAIKTREASYSYSETNGFANSIAEHILSNVGSKLAQAAIIQPNNPEIIFSILGSLKAHKAYVPLDPNFPKERLQFMLEDAEARVLLTDDQHIEFAEELAGGKIPIINTSRIQRLADAPNPQVVCDPLDRAYILFTSGSTGRPKGMAFLHRNLLHTTKCLTDKLFFSPSDRVTWLHSASFAASVVDIYCSLTNGAALYPWDAKVQGFTRLADWLLQEKVTTFQWIPSAFRQFLRSVPENVVFPDIRIVVMASESLTVREVELFRRHFPLGSHLVNQVGTSESYNYRLYAVDHQIPIENANVAGGYAVSDERKVLILDENRRELPIGSVGEIGIKSDFMSAGYWKDEELTRNKFVRMDSDKTPVYLTGDLGKVEPDGCLIHLGRKDFQVKIRGYRVELAEVDHVLTSAPGVADSAAWIAKNQLDIEQLVGYVVLHEGGRFDQQQVERYMESRLPDYMVPRHYVILDSLPILPTGKVDRKGLPNPFAAVESELLTMPNQTHSGEQMAEQKIVNLFKELLQNDRIDANSDFITLGGDSLLTALLLTRIYQCFSVEIQIDEFIASPTPARLAGLVSPNITSLIKEQKPMEDGNRRSFRDIHGRKAPRALWEILPQSVLYGVNIEPTNLCNFRCPFCPTGNPATLASVARPKGAMKMELYRKIIDDLQEMTRKGGRKIASLQLWKDGEPLLHKQLPEMIRIAKQADIADSLELTTNGSLLNAKVVRDILDAGLDLLRISVESVQDSVYQTISNGKYGYADIRRNVSELFKAKTASNSSMHIHSKIIDADLSEEEKSKFIEDFAPISDSWNIESIQGWSRMQIQDFTLGIESTTTMHGVARKHDRLVCPEPFGKLAVNFDGSASICCVDWSYGTVVGDVSRESILDIWNGKRLAEFRIRHLAGQRETIPACSSCDYLKSFPAFADLDDHREELLEVFKPAA